MRPLSLPDPDQLRQTPERGALVLLLAALDLADSALRIEHPALHCDPAPRRPGLPASELLAELLLARFAELTALVCHYNAAVDDALGIDDDEEDLPF